ncbi:MAG: phosphotransferase [SAR324 cluster bacterium]|nr:phosphotransferase [SAR324 cluster bacterium]
MNPLFHSVILDCTGATTAQETEVIQSLWSGYGSIKRYALTGSKHKSVVVKHVQPPTGNHHPQGWNSDQSHLRKVKSYEVERAWYKSFAQECDDTCRIPKCFGLESTEDEVLIVLEDLDLAGFPKRLSRVHDQQIFCSLDWLANFHATFMGEAPIGLWPIGSYWHLETRPDELAALTDKTLKEAAPLIDLALTATPFQTLIHGDAKLANFCFSNDGNKVAAVDFQYVGGGCGMKDLSYLLGSCWDDKTCEKREGEVLDYYFVRLCESLRAKGKKLDLAALEANWRGLYPVAWADFHRFLKGWSPGHWKLNSYSERITKEVIQGLSKR